MSEVAKPCSGQKKCLKILVCHKMCFKKLGGQNFTIRKQTIENHRKPPTMVVEWSKSPCFKFKCRQTLRSQV